MKIIADHFLEIIGALIGLGGAVATILAAYKTEDNNFLVIFVAVLAAEFIVALISIIHMYSKYSFEKRFNILSKEKSELDHLYAETSSRIAELEREKGDIAKELKEESEKQLAVFLQNLKNASKLNNDLCNRVPEISEKAYHVLESMLEGAESGAIKKSKIKEEIQRSVKEFSEGLFDIFKRYCRNFLEATLAMISAYLSIQGKNVKLAATIKLFDKPLCGETKPEDIVVYTAFRDKATYDEHLREIGESKYSIAGNIDFHICLTKDQYIINNAKKNSDQYTNEHKDFDAYYNCAVVVPIKIKESGSTFKFLGYLCCDCLNTEEKIEVFDKYTAQILYAMAQLFGTFLDTMNSNWCDRVGDYTDYPKTFNELVYQITFNGHAGGI